MIKALIFDIGGVLTHTDFPSVYSDFAKRVGVDTKLIEDYFDQHLSEMLIGELGPLDIMKSLRLDEKFSLEETLGIWKEMTLKHRSVDEAMLKMLRDLKKHYKLVALSNLTETRYVSDQSIGIYDFFDHALLSFKEGMKKPDHRFFQLALDRAEVSSDEAVYVDDFQRQIDAATSMGIKSILFINHDQLAKELKDLGIQGI